MYVIHDVKYDTYYSRGTQVSRNGITGPRWSKYRYEAIKFSSISEVIATMKILKKIKYQDNSSIMYEKY